MVCTGVAKSVTSRAATQAVGQRRLGEVDHDRLALRADVDAGLAVRQVDDDAPGAVRSATEVDVANAVGRDRGGRFREAGGRRARGAAGARDVGDRRRQRDHDGVAFDGRREGHAALEVHHQPRAVTGLDEVDRTQVALVGVDDVLARVVRRLHEVERDPRRRGDGERSRHRGRRGLQRDAHDEIAALLRGGHVLDGVVLGRGDRRGEEDEERGRGEQPFAHAALEGQDGRRSTASRELLHRLFSCNCSVVARSTHSPAAS